MVLVFVFLKYLDELLNSLNGMHQLMTGEKDSFDKSFYNELVPCIEQYGVKLLDVVNSQWSGFKVYASNGGNPGVDDWIGCDTRVKRVIVFDFLINEFDFLV